MPDGAMKRRARNSLRPGVICVVALAAATAPAFAALAQAAKAQEPAAQPVPFSHKLHCQKNIPCSVCHQTATSGETAGLPGADVCMACHQSVASGSPAIRKVAAYARQRKPIPWVRVYALQDFVFFSHKRHAGANVACSACHGKVCENTGFKKRVKFSMVSCVSCHKDKKATVRCNACHTLSM
jgi:predicted CXXCH cytochrome family protein